LEEKLDAAAFASKIFFNYILNVKNIFHRSILISICQFTIFQKYFPVIQKYCIADIKYCNNHNHSRPAYCNQRVYICSHSSQTAVLMNVPVLYQLNYKQGLGASLSSTHLVQTVNVTSPHPARLTDSDTLKERMWRVRGQGLLFSFSHRRCNNCIFCSIGLSYLNSLSEYEERVITLSERPRALSADRCELRPDLRKEADRDLPAPPELLIITIYGNK